jgi:hypothetical protein
MRTKRLKPTHGLYNYEIQVTYYNILNLMDKCAQNKGIVKKPLFIEVL